MDSGLTLEDAQSVLIVLAPIIGAPGTLDATANIAAGLGLALDIVDALDADDV